MKEERMIEKILKDFLKDDLNQIRVANRFEDAVLYFGKIMGKLDILPITLACYSKYKKNDPEIIGNALKHILNATYYVFLNSHSTKPKYFDYIMEILDEDKSKQ